MEIRGRLHFFSSIVVPSNITSTETPLADSRFRALLRDHALKEDLSRRAIRGDARVVRYCSKEEDRSSSKTRAAHTTIGLTPWGPLGLPIELADARDPSVHAEEDFINGATQSSGRGLATGGATLGDPGRTCDQPANPASTPPSGCAYRQC